MREEITIRRQRAAQAMAIVSIQAECSLGDALSLMVDRATFQRCALDEIARSVLDGTLRFGD